MQTEPESGSEKPYRTLKPTPPAKGEPIAMQTQIEDQEVKTWQKETEA